MHHHAQVILKRISQTCIARYSFTTGWIILPGLNRRTKEGSACAGHISAQTTCSLDVSHVQNNTQIESNIDVTPE